MYGVCHYTGVSTDRKFGEKSGEDDLAAPQGINLEQRGNRLTIVCRWLRPAYLFLAFFCLIWNVLLVIWFVLAFRESTPIFYKIVSLFLTVAGIGITYLTIAGLLNRTKISIDTERLMVRRGPIPWPGSRDVDIIEVERVECRERVIQGRKGGQQFTVGYRYSVIVHLRDGIEVKLVSRLTIRDQAQFITGIIEKQFQSEKRLVR